MQHILLIPVNYIGTDVETNVLSETKWVKEKHNCK